MTLYFIVVLITLYIITCAAQFSSPAQFVARAISRRAIPARPPLTPAHRAAAQVPLRGDRKGGGDGGARDRPEDGVGKAATNRLNMYRKQLVTHLIQAGAEKKAANRIAKASFLAAYEQSEKRGAIAEN